MIRFLSIVTSNRTQNTNITDTNDLAHTYPKKINDYIKQHVTSTTTKSLSEKTHHQEFPIQPHTRKLKSNRARA